MMQLLAPLAAGFLELVAVGATSPMGGLSASTHFDARFVEPRVSSVPLVVIPIHLASHFQFVTPLKDDGKGPAGGWQEATARLPFGRLYPWGMTLWYCDIKIGMPIRHSLKGYISPATAASESARVTNSATRNMDFDLPQGIFCERFRPMVKEAFKKMYPVGASAQKP